jgi:CRISPR-associated DxTHG motif protein
MIITILGAAGKDKEGNKITAFYNASILNKKSDDYYNSLDFLLKNYQDEEFYLIGTNLAIEYQKDLLDLSGSNIKKIITVNDNSLDDIFEHIFNLMSKTNKKIILDITHGFRHQPISSIFAATLYQFLNNSNLQIIFAKQIEAFKEYEYIFLDSYIEITQISLLLTGFIRTLNFIPNKSCKIINTKPFEEFSISLLSNDIVGVENNYKLLKSELEKLLNNEDFKHLQNLLEDILDLLKPLNDFKKQKFFKKYFILSSITLDKNYLVIALAYMFEALREYCAYKFKPLIKDIEFKNSYELNTSVMDTISNFQRGYKKNLIQKKYSQIYNKNQNTFNQINRIYKEVRELRNSLAHINQEKEFENIKQDLLQIKIKIETLFKDDVLKYIKV